MKLYLAEEDESDPANSEEIAVQIKTVIQDRSRAEIRRLWRDAFSSSVRKLKSDIRAAQDAEKKFLAVISGHSVYYHPSLPQFYCPLDFQHMRTKLQETEIDENNTAFQLRTHHVTLLIDDVLDMYQELSLKDAILSRRTLQIKALNEYRESQGIFEGVREPEVEPGHSMPGTTEEERIVCLETDLKQLIQVLNWRIQEMTIVEHLAVELGAQFALFATKQHMETLRGILLEKPVVYISHPITKPRNDTASSSSQLQDNDLVVGARLLVQSLKGHASISPTGIDELRFQKSLVVEGKLPFRKRSRLLRNGSLSERWPLLDEINSLLYPPTGDEGDWIDTGKRMLAVDCSQLKDRTRVDTAVKQLENWIDLQVGIRDHLIVAHSNSVLVFRQYYRGEESAGVTSEMKHWGYIVGGMNGATALYVFYPEDILNMTMFSGQMAIADSVAETLIEYLGNSIRHLRTSKLREIGTRLGDKDSMLGRLVDHGDWNGIREALERCRIEELTRKALPAICRALIVPVSASFILVKDNDDLLEKIGDIEKALSASPQLGEDTVLEPLARFWADASDEVIRDVLERKRKKGEKRLRLREIVESGIEKWKHPFLMD